MNKILKYGLVVSGTLLFLGIIGFIIFLSSFELFDEPTKEIVLTKCGQEGLRQVSVFTLSGNATANPSVHVSAKLGCDNNHDKETLSIFTADKSFMDGNEVEIEWVSFDTVRMTYDANLRVFKKVNEMTFKDSTLNFVVKYQKKKES